MYLNSAYVYREVFSTKLLIPVTKEAVSGNIISLNDTAALIIKKCGMCLTVDELADMILNGYIDASEKRTSLIQYINSLIASKLLICEEITT